MQCVSDKFGDFLNANRFTRYHLGCGTIFLKDWLNIGYWEHLGHGRVYADPNENQGTWLLNFDLRYGIPAAPNSLDAVYHSHMLEHLSFTDGLEFLTRVHAALKPGGIHRIVVPDLEAFAKAYVSGEGLLLEKYKEEVLATTPDIYVTKASIFMGMLHNHGHQAGWDWETLKWALERAGFCQVKRKLFQESDFSDIMDMEKYSPLRCLESLCVECYK